MNWLELADLPFAAALTPYPGALAPGGDYDSAHFDQLTIDGADAPGSRFLECAFTHVSFQGGQLRRARLTDVWLRDVRLTATGLAESAWAGVMMTESALAGVEAFGAQLRKVVLRAELDSVNFRGAALADVTFDSCLLRDVDFTGAALTRTAFPRSRLTGTQPHQGEAGHGGPAGCRARHHRSPRLTARGDRDTGPARGHGGTARRRPGHRGRRRVTPVTRSLADNGTCE